MSRLIDDDQDELQQRERELTLSTGAILAIFLGLVLLCGLFFGFGYNLGRKSTTISNAALPAATNETESTSAADSTFDNFKPSPSSPSTQSAATSTPAAAATTAAKAAPAPVVATSSLENSKETQPASQPAHTVLQPAASSTVPRVTPVVASTPAPVRPTQSASPAVAPGGAFLVQIAAISAAHKDDADLLANALHTKGYAVTERIEAQDKLIHVQVGPFATKADAEAMRERLIVDGYNPIVK